MSKIKPPSVGWSLWKKPCPGPMAREAVEAIGARSDMDRVQIEIRDGRITVNGSPASETDASLVYNASRCDPHDFQDDPDEELVQHMRRAILIRRMLNLPGGGTEA